ADPRGTGPRGGVPQLRHGSRDRPGRRPAEGMGGAAAGDAARPARAAVLERAGPRRPSTRPVPKCLEGVPPGGAPAAWSSLDARVGNRWADRIEPLERGAGAAAGRALPGAL